jgi:hypothetical protein
VTRSDLSDKHQITCHDAAYISERLPDQQGLALSQQSLLRVLKLMETHPRAPTF